MMHGQKNISLIKICLMLLIINLHNPSKAKKKADHINYERVSVNFNTCNCCKEAGVETKVIMRFHPGMKYFWRYV